MARKNTLYSTVIPDQPASLREALLAGLIQPSQSGLRSQEPCYGGVGPEALLRRSRLGNPDSEKFLLDSRLRGNENMKGLQIYSINHTMQAGITLVEIVVAAFILIASLTVLLLTFSRVKHNAETARRELNALHVARTELEQLRSTTYLNITSYAATNLTNSFFIPLRGTKQCTVVGSNSYKEISITISWISTVGTQKINQTFNTIICSTN